MVPAFRSIIASTDTIGACAHDKFVKEGNEIIHCCGPEKMHDVPIKELKQIMSDNKSNIKGNMHDL